MSDARGTAGAGVTAATRTAGLSRIDAPAEVSRVRTAREGFADVRTTRKVSGLPVEGRTATTGNLWGAGPQTYPMAGINSAMRLSQSWEGRW
jgi:hypothetical protein